MTRDKKDASDVGINEAFPDKICINLDRRPDRWQRMQRKFDRHGIHSVRRFSALDGDALSVPTNWFHTRGAYGCLVSHLEVVREARRLGLSQVLIFEDDVVFDPELQGRFDNYFGQLPRDWHMLYFGALHKDDPIKISDNIVRITRANSTYAYVLRDAVFDAFIELNSRAETVLDDASFILQQQFNCYCFTPHLAWVETDYSDAQNRLEHHWYLEKSLVLFGSQVDRLLSETTLILAHRGIAGSVTENLLYLVRYYNEFFASRIAIVIVEQGAQPTVDPATLPANCTYVFLRDDGPFNREWCFNAGISNSNPTGRFLILSDSDIYVETLDIRANLRMCEAYDCATGFSEIIDLTGEETLRLRAGNTTRGLDITKRTLRTGNEHPGCCVFVRTEVRGILGGLNEAGWGKVDSVGSIASTGQLRIFRSPNRALRLSS